MDLLDTKRPRALLIAFCLLVWLPGFFTLPPTDRDESRFAQASKQMIETGDYVRIMNGTEPRNRKPIGIHWLQVPFAAAARALASPPPTRSGPTACPRCWAACWPCWRRSRSAWPRRPPRRALLAGGMLAACVLLTVETHLAKTDAALLGATTVAMAVLARAYAGPPVGRGQAALFWLAMGAGILLKGPITPMVAGLAALTLVLADRRAGWLRALRPASGVPLMAAIVLPWFVAIGLATHGAFFGDAVGGDLGRKLASGDDAHGAPPGLHLLLLPLLAFPATLPLLRALPQLVAARRDPACRFLLAWIVPAWVVFEAVPTKLPHYTLPLYPAVFLLAALAAASLAGRLVGPPRRARRDRGRRLPAGDRRRGAARRHRRARRCSACPPCSPPACSAGSRCRPRRPGAWPWRRCRCSPSPCSGASCPPPPRSGSPPGSRRPCARPGWPAAPSPRSVSTSRA